MLRFIFACMAVVALSLIAIGTQFVTDGISNEAANVMARNAETAEDTQAIAREDAISPEDLNAIETTAGTPDYDPNDTFSSGFTNEAPRALADDTPANPVAVGADAQAN